MSARVYRVRLQVRTCVVRMCQQAQGARLPPGMAIPHAMSPPSAHTHPSPHMHSPPHMHTSPHMHTPPQGERSGAEMQLGSGGMSGANEDDRGDASGGEVQGGEGGGVAHYVYKVF